MFNKALDVIRGADQFGAVYKPSVKLKQSQYKTLFGGILTVTIYGLSLAYIVYEYYVWQTGGMLPKLTHLKTSLSDFSYHFKELAVFHMRNHFNEHESFIDPFKSSAIIMAPVLYVVEDGIPKDPTYLQSGHLDEKHNTIEIELKNLKLHFKSESDAENPSIEYLISFERCRQELLKDQATCADDKTMKHFFDQKANQLVVKNYLMQYNTSDKRLERIEDDYFVSFDEETTYFSQCAYEIAEVKVDNGLLFDSWEKFLIPSNILHITQNMDIHYFEKYLGVHSYLVFQFEISIMQDHILIEYPKASEIMANVGSIISIIFFLSYIALLINEAHLEHDAIRLIVEMFYPQIKDVVINKNLFGKITSVTYQNKPIDVQKFAIKYEQLQNIAREKLTIINQIYETSRIQFIMQTLVTKEQIKASHSAGIKLDILEEQIQRTIEQQLRQRDMDSMSVIKNDLEQSIVNDPSQQMNHCTIEMMDQEFARSGKNLQSAQNLQIFIQKEQEVENEFDLCDEDFGLLNSSNQQQNNKVDKDSKKDDRSATVNEKNGLHEVVI